MDARNLLCGHCGPRTATSSCKTCGQPLCQDCLVEGRCPACARQAAQRRRLWRGRLLTLAAGAISGLVFTSAVSYALRPMCRLDPTRRSLRILQRQVASLQDDVIALQPEPSRRSDSAPAARAPAVAPLPSISPATAAAVASATATARRTDDPVPIALDQLILRVGPGRYVVDRRGAARLLDDPHRQGRVRIVPTRLGRGVMGFKLYGVRPGSTYDLLGLKSGDVVVKVNGIGITSPDQALRVYSRLRRAKRITLRILRRSRPRTLRYWITPG